MIFYNRSSLSRLNQLLFVLIINIGITLQAFGGCTISHECLDKQGVYGTITTIFRGSDVEPTIAVNPTNKKHIVAAWQQNRISNGGSLEAGIAYSKDGGKSWYKSKIPFQICRGGISQRSGDEWLSYSADGSRLYLCAALLNATREPHTKKQSGVVVTISEDDGVTWSHPHYLFSSRNYISDPTKRFANPDKTSITADPNDSNRAITVWATFDPSSSSHGVAQSSYTVNGGKSWSPVQLVYDAFPDLTKQGLSNGIKNDNQTSNNIVVILPKNKKSHERRLSGDWLNFAVRVYAKPGATDAQFMEDFFPFQFSLTDIVLVRSRNKGQNWDGHAKIVVPSFVNNWLYTGGYTYNTQGDITGGIGSRMRNDQTIPSYNVNPKNGFLYVAYQSSEFRADQLQQIGLVTSRDGGHTWSTGVQVNCTPTNAKNPQAFAPFVAITKNGRVGILYFDFRNDDLSDPRQTKMDAWLAIYQEAENQEDGSAEIGLEFVKEIRLSKQSYIAQNGPNTTQGYMTDGDYQFLTAVDNNFYAIYTKSFKGPFKPAVPFFADPIHDVLLFLDNNRRTAPFVSVIRNDKTSAHLISTTRVN